MGLQQTAINLIKRFGGERSNVTVNRKSGGSYDPVTGSETGSVVVGTPVNAIKLTRVSDHWADTLIQKASLEIITDSQFEVIEGDDIRVDGEDYEVLAINTVKPSDVIYIQRVLIGG